MHGGRKALSLLQRLWREPSLCRLQDRDRVVLEISSLVGHDDIDYRESAVQVRHVALMLDAGTSLLQQALEELARHSPHNLQQIRATPGLTEVGGNQTYCVSILQQRLQARATEISGLTDPEETEMVQVSVRLERFCFSLPVRTKRAQSHVYWPFCRKNERSN